MENARKNVVFALVLLNPQGDAPAQPRDDKLGLAAAGLCVIPAGRAEPQ